MLARESCIVDGRAAYREKLYPEPSAGPDFRGKYNAYRRFVSGCWFENILNILRGSLDVRVTYGG